MSAWFIHLGYEQAANADDASVDRRSLARREGRCDGHHPNASELWAKRRRHEPPRGVRARIDRSPTLSSNRPDRRRRARRPPPRPPRGSPGGSPGGWTRRRQGQRRSRRPVRNAADCIDPTTRPFARPAPSRLLPPARALHLLSPTSTPRTGYSPVSFPRSRARLSSRSSLVPLALVTRVVLA